ncbi:MAG: hypothetical protein ACREBE_20675, partial [bacterium]
VIEFHDTDICASLFNAQMHQLLDHFRVVHVHGNNFGDLAVDGSLPLTLEITFVHRSIRSEAPRRHLVWASHDQLDAPNDPTRPDYVLDRRAR